MDAVSLVGAFFLLAQNWRFLHPTTSIVALVFRPSECFSLLFRVSVCFEKLRVAAAELLNRPTDRPTERRETTDRDVSKIKFAAKFHATRAEIVDSKW